MSKPTFTENYQSLPRFTQISLYSRLCDQFQSNTFTQEQRDEFGRRIKIIDKIEGRE